MKLTSFYSKISITLIIGFLSHLLVLYWMDLPLLANKIIESYAINALTAVLLFYIIDKHKARFKDNIGFIFMLSSYLKFGLFFLFIYSSYKLDSHTTRLEFLTFFTPYTMCLIIETRALIKLLNKLDYKD